MSWNRTYRPHTFTQLHLTQVREYCLSLLAAEHFPQVFLFTGPKGTGKTSTSRIVGAVLNDPANAESVQALFFAKKKPRKPLQEPSDTPLTQRILSGNSFVVHELDAASNRGIDDVRALRERVMLPPSEGLMSVYILDEVHMLTTEAFNALLKLLEEPPPHVIFILATTEKEKLPETIVSRCHVVQFSQAQPAEIKSALKNITELEKIEVSDQILSQVATRAEGSFRDAVKLLEMIVQLGNGQITESALETVLSLSLEGHVVTLVKELLDKNARGVIEVFQTLRAQNVNSKLLHKAVLNHLYQDLLKTHKIVAGKAEYPQAATLFLLRELSPSELSVPAPIALLPLELKFLEVIERSQKKQASSTPSGSTEPSQVTQAPVQKEQSLAQKQAEVVITSVPVLELSALQLPIAENSTRSEVVRRSGTLGDGATLCQRWSEFVALTRQHNFGLATLLNSARPLSGSEGLLTLSVFYSFHKEQLLLPKFRIALQEMCELFIGGSVELECILATQPESAELAEVRESETLTQLAVASLM